MPHLLLNLRDVPEDEAEEVRALLHEHRIAFYETPPGPWGLSAGGIWVERDGQIEKAQRLLEGYSGDRQQRMRAEWEAARRAGTADTVRSRLRRHPFVVVLILALAGFFLYVSVVPFMRFG